MNLDTIAENINRLLSNIWAILGFLKEFTVDDAKIVTITYLDSNGAEITKSFSNIAKMIADFENSTKTAELISINNSNFNGTLIGVANVQEMAEKMDVNTPKYYDIGETGEKGFGIGIVPSWRLPAGIFEMNGTTDINSPNYGNYIDGHNSILVCVPKCYYKIDGNTFDYKNVPTAGYILERCFINAGIEKDAIFIYKYQGGNNNGIFASIRNTDPVSTSSSHNPVASINGCEENRYDELYTACKSAGANYFLTPIFVYSMLARIAKAHSDTADIANCAYKDVAPYLPKGCNNNALADAEDASVAYTSSGYSNCGKTGSGIPFAKTTHNGQDNGIADLNGNMWEVASGITRDATNFKILKESVDIAILTEDTAYDYTNYDTIDLSDLVSGNDGWVKLGNGSNQTFGFDADKNTLTYKKTALGIPLSTGTTSEGTVEFGNDGIYRYLTTDLTCLVGGGWGDGSLAGVFTLYLNGSRSTSHSTVGGRASVFL